MTKRQMQDNADDLGRRPEGSKKEQPGTKEVTRINGDTVEAERDGDEKSSGNPSPMNPAFP
jgi:hypothetical protein